MPVDASEEVRRVPRAESKGNGTALPAGQGSHGGGANEAQSLVQKAYKQLSARKESIEAELARIEALRAEHESVTAQVAALDEAMKAFQR